MRLAILFGIAHVASVNGFQNVDHLGLLQQNQGKTSRIVDGDDVVDEGLGMNVPISEKGYQMISDLKDDHEMRSFIERAIQQEGRYVKDESGLSGVVPYYSGSLKTQSLAALRNEMKTATWVGEGEGRIAPLNEMGYQKIVDLKSKPNMMAFARRILDAFNKHCTDEKALSDLVASYDGQSGRQNFANFKKELVKAPWVEARGVQEESTSLLQRPAEKTIQIIDDSDKDEDGMGMSVPISEKGYKLISDLKDDHEMRSFIERAIQQEGRQVKDAGGLAGVVPYYSGKIRTQTLAALRTEIETADWVGEGEGRTAPLNEKGYQKVANLKSKPDMMAFARRILDAFNKRCTDQNALTGLVAYYDGHAGLQDFASLKKELLKAPWAESREAPEGAAALLQKPKEKSVHIVEEKDTLEDGIGMNVPITERGYKLVSDLKDDREMRSFINRAIRQEARYVKEQSGLTGAVPYYSGTTSVQSLAALRNEIKNTSWVGESEGRIAPLNEAGYQKVANLKSKPDMVAFARRILDAYKKHCSDENALSGLVAYYDGKNDKQDFATLKKELLAAPWVEARDVQHGASEETLSDKLMKSEEDE